MEAQEIEKKVRDTLEGLHIIKAPFSEVNNMDHFITDLDVDSVGLVTALTAIEKAFGIDIPPKDFCLENFQNINSVITYVQKRLES